MQHATPTANPPAALVDLARPHLDGQTEAPWQLLAGGRTNQLWRVGGRVVKLYDPRAATPLFPNDPAAEKAALKAFAPLGFASTFRTHMSGGFGDAIIYDYIAGPTGYSDPEGLARLLNRVHSAGRPDGLRRAPQGVERLAAAAIAMLDQVVHPVATDLDQRVRGLADDLRSLPKVDTARTCVIHADPVGANVVNTPSGPILIDWQCPALGDPCEDIAMVLSPSMQRAYDTPMDACAAQAFLDAYPQQEVIARYRRLAPVFHLRMAAYALWSLSIGRTTNDEAVLLECDAARAALSLAGS